MTFSRASNIVIQQMLDVLYNNVKMLSRGFTLGSRRSIEPGTRASDSVTGARERASDLDRRARAKSVCVYSLARIT